MALPRKRRLLLLCASFLLCDQLSFPTNPAASKSWFDQHLAKKTQALYEHIRSSNEPDALISVALLDEVCDLRDKVSDPYAIDSTLARIANDPAAPAAVREEATYLGARVRGAPVETPQSVNALIVRTASEKPSELELQDAISVITSVHGLEMHAVAEHTAEGNNSPEAWYRESKNATDEYRRLQTLRKTLQLNRDYLPAVIDMAKRYSAQGQITRARNMLSATLERYPAEPSLRVLLAELDINQGHASAALEIMSQLRSRILPVAVTRQLADDYAQLRFVHEAQELAHTALQLHPSGIEERELALRLDLQAGDATLNSKQTGVRSPEEARSESSEAQDETALRRLLNGHAASAHDSREFFADASKLAQKWQARPLAERSESRILADVRVDQLRPDYQDAQHVQQVIAIGAAGDVVTYKQRGIQYSAQSQQLNVLHARAHHGDGRISEAEDLGESSVADSSAATYDDLRTRQYRLKDLRAGDVIELEYTITPLTTENPYGQYFAQLIAFGSSIPCDFQRYVLRSPHEIHLSSSERSLPAATIQQRPAEDIRIWERKDIAALVREPNSPSWSEQGAYVHVSNFETWQELGKWYANLIRPQFKLNEQLERQAAEIVRNHPNRLDRVAAIDELVLTNTRYVALELGVYGFKPYPVTQTFARRFGDCKDKASLMVALLRAADIDAQIALVRTKRLGDIAAQPASVSIFDHAIVYVPEFDLWLDGTAEFSRLRELPVDDQGVMALTVTANGDAVLRRTPVSSAEDNYSRRTINAHVDTDGTIRFSGATYVRGEDAPELRRQLEPGESKLGYVQDRLAQVLPAVEVHDVQLPVSLSDAVSLSFDGELTVFHGRHLATLPSSWMERNYLETLAAKNMRSQDLLLEAPWITTEEIHIELPPGARLSGIPDNQSVSTEFGNATIRYHVAGEQITILSTVQFSATRIPAAQYRDFRKFASEVEAAFHCDLEVELP
ncbi:MAG: hypothetical protein DMG62_10390 [Acidobacteria bacterium]|nr:MAG: hypothetical protein DMG62_10390 [Acidobacteriota bacterium]